MQRYKFNHGFTLLELIVSMTVLAILVGVGVPSFKDTLDKRRVTGAAEELQSDLQYARSEAIRRNANVVVSFVSGTTTWCYVIDTETCTCTLTDACQVNGVIKMVDQTGFRGVGLTQNFDGNDLAFSPRRFSLDTGTASFTANTGTSDARTVSVKVGLVGRVKLCSPSGSTNVAGYGTC